ncbi:MAG TPA: sulfotransferase [Bacteroidetes bacterium]|nr:sulfotransferase [Bacteroidota bacterium]
MDQFRIPPVSPLLGSTLPNFFRLIKKGHIDPKYYFKLFLTFLIIAIATPFHLWEKIWFSKKLKRYNFKEPPVFIIGHWRSGTTLLHTSLCKDPEAGYVTTYQSVFPNNLASKWLFKPIMALKIPRCRPSDNMPLHPDYPQEDELAFSNCQPYAYYTFFYFPDKYKAIYDQSVHHKGLTPEEKERWFAIYQNLLKKAMLNTGGKRLIIKNPVNTARIKHILKLYPDAKFLYIYRNPVSTFLSSRLFFQRLLPTITLRKLDNNAIEEMVFDVYSRLINDYLDQKNLIPQENILEIRYEDLIKDPEKCIKTIYSQLLKKDFNSVRNIFSTYFTSAKGYKKNLYEIDRPFMDKINTRLKKFMDLYHYDIPEEVIITE